MKFPNKEKLDLIYESYKQSQNKDSALDELLKVCDILNTSNVPMYILNSISNEEFSKNSDYIFGSPKPKRKDPFAAVAEYYRFCTKDNEEFKILPIIFWK